MLYSHSTKGFYKGGVHAAIPEDAIELTDREYADLQCARSSMIDIGADGRPFISEIPDPSIEPVHTQCTAAQGLVALFTLKQITDADVISAIEKIPNGEERYIAKIGYTHSKSWERDSPTMRTIADLLQLTDEDMDALFAKAVTVEM